MSLRKYTVIIFNAVFKALFLKMWTSLPASYLESLFKMQILRPDTRYCDADYLRMGPRNLHI